MLYGEIREHVKMQYGEVRGHIICSIVKYRDS